MNEILKKWKKLTLERLRNPKPGDEFYESNSFQIRIYDVTFEKITVEQYVSKQNEVPQQLMIVFESREEFLNAYTILKGEERIPWVDYLGVDIVLKPKEAEISPCPFCLNKNVKVEIKDCKHVVCCENCGTEGPSGEDDKEAILLWNLAKR